MNVNDFDKYISSYLEGDLRLSEIKEFEELLQNNPECRLKLESYKTMLSELSNLEFLRTSNNFMDKLHQKIDKPSKVSLIKRIEAINLFGYDYISIAGIAAALTMFIFSVSIFINSNSAPIVNLNELSTKNIKNDSTIMNNNDQLLSEDDTLTNNESVNFPIQLVGGKK